MKTRFTEDTITPHSEHLKSKSAFLKNGHLDTKVINFGMFKGRKDTRGLRCVNQQCKVQKYARCTYCKSLPYIPSRLGRESNLHFNVPLKANSYESIAEDDSEIIMYGIERLNAMVSNKSKGNTNIRTKTFVNSQPLLKARAQLARMKTRPWAREVMGYFEGEATKKVAQKYPTLALMSKKPTSSSNPP